MRQAITKSKSKTFDQGDVVSDLLEWVQDNTRADGSLIKHKYVLTVTKIITHCPTCGEKLMPDYNEPYCFKCRNKNHEKI